MTLTDEQEQHVEQLRVITGRDYDSYARQDERFGEHLFWDEDAPEWHAVDHDYAYRTVVAYELFEVATPEGWERDATYDLGKGECWCVGDPHKSSGDTEAGPDSACGVCEGDGLVWLGDGWREVVYRRHEREDDLDDARFCARSILAVQWIDDTGLETRADWEALDPHGDVERWPEAIRFGARDDEVILLPGGRAREPEPDEYEAYVAEWRACIADIRAAILDPSPELLDDARECGVWNDEPLPETPPFAVLVQCAGCPTITNRGDWTC